MYGTHPIRRKVWLLVWVVVLAGLSGGGCSGERAAPVVGSAEAERQAEALRVSLFVEREGRWVGLDQLGEAWRLIELEAPEAQVMARMVSDEERASGLSERHTLTIHCARYRFWDREWTDWRRAPGGGPSRVILSKLSPTGMGLRIYTLEKQNGRWSVKGAASRLESDADALARLMKVAYPPE